MSVRMLPFPGPLSANICHLSMVKMKVKMQVCENPFTQPVEREFPPTPDRSKQRLLLRFYPSFQTLL